MSGENTSVSELEVQASEKPSMVTLMAKSRDEAVYPGEVKVEVDEELHKQYGFEPEHCGERVIFLNASNPAYYRRTIANARLQVWILTRGVNVGYVLRRLFEEAEKQGVQVQFHSTSSFNLVVNSDSNERIYVDGQTLELPDVVLTRVGAQIDYHGLAVLRHLEKVGVPVINGLDSINLSRDKLSTLHEVAAHGVPIPRTIVAKFPIDIDMMERELGGFPLILKKTSGSQGAGVMKIDSRSVLEDVADMLDRGTPLVFQEFVKESTGRDLRVFVVGGRVVGTMMRVARSGFKANVHQGGSVRAAQLSPEAEWLVLEIVRIIGLDVAGVDLLIGRSTYMLCEINSSPGFEGLERALGRNVGKQIISYIKVRMGMWKLPTKNRRTTAVADAVAIDQRHVGP